MSKFKVGDKVRFTNQTFPRWVGQEGEVVSVKDDSVTYVITKAAPTDLSRTWNTVGNTITNGEDCLTLLEEKEAVEHPAHYGGDTTYEVIKVAEAWGLDQDAYLFNVLKYIARAGKKSADTELQDNEKAYFYLGRKIKRLKEKISDRQSNS